MTEERKPKMTKEEAEKELRIIREDPDVKETRRLVEETQQLEKEKASQQQETEEEEKPLSRKEKEIIAGILKVAKGRILNLARKIEEKAEYRHEVEQAIIELAEILDMTPWEDEDIEERLQKEGITEKTRIDSRTIKYLTNEQLEKLWQESLRTIEEEL